MALSFVTIPAPGGQNQFDFPFPYLAQEHVFVSVDGVVVNRTFVNTNRVELSVTPAAGASVRIYRQTPTDALLVAFQANASITSQNLNTALLQALYVVQEAADAAGLSVDLSEFYARNAAWFYDVVVSIPFRPETDELLLHMPMVRTVQLLGNAEGSQVHAAVAPGVDVTFELLRNGQVVGTATIPAAGGAGSFSVATPVSFAVGDRFGIRLVGPPPSGWRDFGFTFKMLKVLP